MEQHSKPYLPSVLGFAALTALSYMVGISNRNIDMPTSRLIVNSAIYTIVGAVYGWLVWQFVLHPQSPTWIKGALLSSSIGFCFYFFNTGMANTMESLLLCCAPVGAILGALIGVGQSRANSLAKQRYLERGRD